MLVVLTISRGLSGTETVPMERGQTCYKYGESLLHLSLNVIYIDLSISTVCITPSKELNWAILFCLLFLFSLHFL